MRNDNEYMKDLLSWRSSFEMCPFGEQLRHTNQSS